MTPDHHPLASPSSPLQWLQSYPAHLAQTWTMGSGESLSERNRLQALARLVAYGVAAVEPGLFGHRSGARGAAGAGAGALELGRR